MLDWLFGSKKEEKKGGKKEEKPEDKLGENDKLMYDYVKQYLSSPLWRNPLLDFIEQNCLIFDDSEENKFEYTKVFQQFTGLTALLLESMIQQVGITEATLEKCIIRGMKSQKDSRIFQQILYCDDFLSFKKILVSKNKELEIEAMRKLQQQSKGESKAETKEIEISVKELQRMQLQKVIAMSKAMDAKTQEEKELQEAIRQSQVEFEKEETKRVEEKKKVEKKQQVRRPTLGPLPPLSTVRPPRPIQEYKIEETKLKEQIEVMKKEEDVRKIKEKDNTQNEDDRKKRLLQQRQLIRKKKQDERKDDLATFMQTKPAENKVSEQELERRRNLMKRLKEQLKN